MNQKPRIHQSDIIRFNSKILIQDSGCYHFDGCSDKDGYGLFQVDGFRMRAHRFSYIIYNNMQFPADELFVCHTCDNPNCINPNHLFLDTHLGNENDKTQKNRRPKGNELNRSDVLNDDIIYQLIIDIYNNKYSCINEIEFKLGVHRDTISDILKGKTWKHITNQLSVPLQTIKDIVIQKTKLKTKMTGQLILEIKQDLKLGLTQKSISENRNISKSVIGRIYRGETYSHIN